ncbi:hypothetical protein BRY73_19140 [Ochrobactrum sp. P6BS-III]|uniref:hypothetical protein n=1 Tax=unclassified Ochrobactrum TaxID=239106 RepID=UPI00099385A7|nr:hypothetical protein [Ochrobactrum sp. P6BSIII]OOL15408.1 hypothetical protein BRY73_19140 [Ochrobactrum sp. P6BS-III]
MADGDLSLLGIGLTALLSTLGTLGVTYFSNRASRTDKEDERRKHGQYLAARVVCELDPFVEKCLNVTADNGEPDWQQEGEYVCSVQSPDLLLPDDVDWKSIPHDLMYRILSLQNQIEYSERVISSVFEIDSPPNYDQGFRERQFQYAKIGTLALDIATDLRKTFDLPFPDYDAWDPRTYLDKVFIRENEVRQMARRAAKRFVAEQAVDPSAA